MKRTTLSALSLVAVLAASSELPAQRGGGGGGGRGAGGGPNRNVLVVPGERHGTSVFTLTNYP